MSKTGARIGQDVDPICTKFPEWLDAIIRDKDVVPVRSRFLRRATALLLVYDTHRAICGSDIAEMVETGILLPEDIILLVKGDAVSVELVTGLIDDKLIKGKNAKQIKEAFQTILSAQQDLPKAISRQKVRKANTQRRSV